MTPVPAIPATPGEETDKFWRDRLGKLTASRMADAVGKQKRSGEYKEARKKYMIELIAERLTGMSADQYLSSSMLWGIETEPQARAAYEAKTGERVIKTGFCDHPIIPGCGASPDGLAGYDGLVEIKCPESRTHIAYLMGRVVPEDYLPQIYWQMACCPERQWVDFVSFDPRMPKDLRLFVARVPRDEKLIAGYEKEAIGFLREMSFAIEAIEGGHVASEDI